MEKKAFQLLHDAESSWWYKGRSFVVKRVVKKHFQVNDGGLVCDFGAGHGGMFSMLRQYGKVMAIEPDEGAQKSCLSRGYESVQTSTNLDTFTNEQFSMVGLFDVLEHTEDDREFLNKLHRVLKIKGALVLTVPAFAWLWSQHDVEHHHYRRYNIAQLKKLLADCGYTVKYGSYWNMLLFPLAALVRLRGWSGESALAMHPMVNNVFYAIVLLESVFIPLMRLPFGTGIVVYAEKNSIS